MKTNQGEGELVPKSEAPLQTNSIAEYYEAMCLYKHCALSAVLNIAFGGGLRHSRENAIMTSYCSYEESTNLVEKNR